MAKTLLPSSFTVTDEMLRWARWKAPGLDLDNVTQEFCDYWHGHGKMMSDWVATWRNWVRKAHREGKHRLLRAQAPVEHAKPSGPEIDAWEAAGNAHLLKHIKARMSKGPRRYGDPGGLLQGRYLKQPGDELRARVLKLVRAKQAWQTDMQDLAQAGEGVPVEIQKAVWADYIRKAEA